MSLAGLEPIAGNDADASDAGITDRLSSRYERIRAEGRDAIASGRHTVDPLPVDGQERWGVSAVLRLRWTDAIADGTRALTSLTGRDGCVYGPSNLHLTIRQFEGFRERVPATDARLHSYVDALSAFTRDEPPLVVDFVGLSVGPGGALMQGWPRFDLQALRRKLHRIAAADGVPITGPERTIDALRTTAHATLSIFGESLARGPELLAWADSHRDTQLGTQTFDALWLVGYRRTLRTVRLIEYRRFALGGAT